MHPVHRPVLVAEVMAGLQLEEGLVVVDGTVGAGGHARAMAQVIGRRGVLVGLDRDEEILEHARRALADVPARVLLFHREYRRIGECLEEAGLDHADRILLDLGCSSWQLDQTERGFSFMHDAPLDLRMDRSRGATGAQLVNRLSERDLAGLFRELGEEPFAGRIARAIVTERARSPIARTTHLAEVVARAVPHFRRRARLHPATQVFMALRIAVNDELGELKAGLAAASGCLRPGPLAVISFHSLEDRIVKEFMRTTMQPVTRKPVRPGEAEVRRNPRARSARLRMAVRREV